MESLGRGGKLGKLSFFFLSSKVSQILFMFCVLEHFFKYWEGFPHYTLETQVIKGH